MQNHHSRRRFLSTGLGLALGGLAGVFGRPAGAQVQGRDYVLLPQPQAKEDPKKIEVIEFFSYGCGHCNDFYPILKAWVEKLPADVAFRRVPVTWNAAWANLARLYYTLEATGDLARLDGAVFDALHKERLRLYDEQSMTAWYVRQGGNAKKFADAFNSFNVMSKLRRAEQEGRAMQIDGVPTLVVEGRYRIQGEDFQRMLANAEAVIAMARRK